MFIMFVNFEGSMRYAYIRVSSVDQNTARQEEAFSKAGFQIDQTYIEQASAKDANRPQLQSMLGQVRTGDTIIVHSIDRLCRNMMDMCSITTNLRSRGVSLIFLKEQLTFHADTSNPMQDLQLHMMSAFSQFERSLIKERQADGIAAKKARGEKTGRPVADIEKISQIEALKAKGIKLKLACDNVGLGVSTYYKLRNQMKNQ
jgi:DNA invertase Pin-like site-specific DNA recombinase